MTTRKKRNQKRKTPTNRSRSVRRASGLGLVGRLAGGLNRNQQTDVYQRLSGFLLPRGAKTELAETLLKRVKLGDFKESELWCLSRLAARKLFYGPTNLVIPPAAVARWVEALLNIPTAGDALAAMARRTDDPMRDLPIAAREAVSRKLQTLPHAARLSAVLEGEEDDTALGRIFGEELPSGLVLETPGAVP